MVAGILVPLPTGDANADILEANMRLLAVFMKLALPGWDESLDWLQDHLVSTIFTDGEEHKILDQAVVSLKSIGKLAEPEISIVVVYRD